uniref:AMP-binding protein n=1 Tax=Cytobacillus sp. TaxID=2675269 RepID=UPI003515DE73
MSEKKTWHARYPESIASEVNIPSKSMPEMLQEVTAMYPQNTALSFYGRKMLYTELQKAVYGFAASLQKNGVQKGGRVAIMLPNCPQYVIAYYGTLA